MRREEDITVTLPDGSAAPATPAGSDAGTDIAVLKVESSGPALVMAGEPAPGEAALAGFRRERHHGIVSAVSGAWRTWRERGSIITSAWT